MTNDAIMTIKTTPLEDLSNLCDGRIEMTNERVLGIAREYLGSPLHDWYHSNRALKCCTLLNSKHFLKWRSFEG
jgi:hypothetical protein